MATQRNPDSREIRTSISQKVQRAAAIAANARRNDLQKRQKEKTHREYWRLGCERVGIELTSDVASAIGHLWSLRSHQRGREKTTEHPASNQGAAMATSKPQRAIKERQLPLFPGPQHLWKL